MLKDLQDMVLELQNTSSSNDKKEILKRYPQCKDYLRYTYDTLNYKYYISSDNVKKQEKQVSATSGPNLFGGGFPTGRVMHFQGSSENLTLESLLEDLNSRKVTGLQAVKAVLSFTKRKENYPYTSLIFSIIDRDLQCRISETIINKVWPGLIPVFSVALANKYRDCKDKVDFENETWLSSHKMDGARCITILEKNSDPKCYSRNGEEFNTLQKLKEEIKFLWPDVSGYVFDGEICIIDDEGNESFSEIMKQIQRNDFNIEHPRYRIFDILTLDEFYARESTTILSQRQSRWSSVFKDIKSDIIVPLEQIKVKNSAHLETMFAEAQAKNWEGLIIRKDTTYKGKRSNDLLKVKQMLDGEYQVIRAETGPFRIVKNGKETTENVLAKVFIIHKGCEVGVGSGFTLDERRDFRDHPERIVGKTIIVQYFEETQNQNGGYSLRFPVFKYLYNGKRTI